MTILHSEMPSAKCHEPKHITTSAVTDAGKVITPSSSTQGASVLRYLTADDLEVRVVTLVDAATIAVDSDTTDIGDVVLTANRVLGAPSGTPADGQRIVLRVAQDAIGGRVLIFDPAYYFPAGLPSPSLAANARSAYAFTYNADTNTWDQFLVPVSSGVYSGKTIKNNAAVIAVPAMTDATNFSTVADWRQVTGIFEVTEVAPSSNVTRGANDFTILVSGVYRLEAQATASLSANGTMGLTFGVGGVVLPDRAPVVRMLSGDKHTLYAHAFVTLLAGQVVTGWVAADAAVNITLRQGRLSLQLIERTI